jgi:hypothetical protein
MSSIFSMSVRKLELYPFLEKTPNAQRSRMRAEISAQNNKEQTIKPVVTLNAAVIAEPFVEAMTSEEKNPQEIGKNVVSAMASFSPVSPLISPVYDAAYAGHEAHHKGHDFVGVVTSSIKGGVKGTFRTFFPIVTNMQSVIGPKNLTLGDRVLNFVDNGSQTVYALGYSATLFKAATGHPDFILLALAGVSGLANSTNIAVNFIKYRKKVRGRAGSDQDGGYIYNILNYVHQHDSWKKSASEVVKKTNALASQIVAPIRAYLCPVTPSPQGPQK